MCTKDNVEHEESDSQEDADATDRGNDRVGQHRNALIAFDALDSIVGRTRA